MIAVLACAIAIAGASEQPGTPHFGNVYLHGETVRVAGPEDVRDETRTWRVLDDAHDVVAEGAIEARRIIELGTLPIGWYRVEFLDETGQSVAFTTAAVVHKSAIPPPDETPVAVDIALSWLARDEPAHWPEIARLASLAGAGWVRDRIHWREMQAESGEFFEETHYDTTARIQSGQGHRVLQVFHTIPAWARDNTGRDRPRTDLRHVHRFCREMAVRFQGRVHAWQPWNEGNARNFGGLTMDELCTHQKVAYLGFKAGDPDLTVCWAPLGGIDTEAQVQAILRNETWPYYDIYSIHSYDWPHAYADLWEPARRAACGRPIWVTECDRGMTVDPASPVGDYTHENARLKAQFVAQSYASSLSSGASRHFHFILGPYTERDGTIQFGLLRHDYTPRISYTALAAVGRFLAGATSLGRWELPDQPDAHVYAFRGRPDGEARDVLVAWIEKEADWPGRGEQVLPWPLPEPLPVEAAFDYLGRPLEAVPPETIASAPLFALLPEGAADSLLLQTIAPSEYRAGTPSPVVLQFDTPNIAPVIRQREWTHEPERVFDLGTETECALLVYNFSDTEVTGTISLTEAPEGVTISAENWNVILPPMERQILEFRITVPASHESKNGDWILFQGDFGPAGTPVLAFEMNRPESEG